MAASPALLGLGPALSLIGEWQPADFSHIAGAGDWRSSLGLGLALCRGFTLPPVRILILLGLMHLALSAERNGEILGLLAPLFLAAPLARQLPALRAAPGNRRPAAAAAHGRRRAAGVPLRPSAFRRIATYTPDANASRPPPRSPR